MNFNSFLFDTLTLEDSIRKMEAYFNSFLFDTEYLYTPFINKGFAPALPTGGGHQNTIGSSY